MPVSANGRSHDSEFGRSPKPLPKSKVGDSVVKSGAPADRLPVFRQVTSRAASAIASCSPLMKSWYCVPVVRPVPPVTVGRPGLLICAQSLPIVKSHFGVISIDKSLPRSHSREPSLCVGFRVIVGSDISEATNGSSVRIVAGKKRSPAKPCAIAPAPGISAAAAAATKPRQDKRFMDRAPPKNRMEPVAIERVRTVDVARQASRREVERESDRQEEKRCAARRDRRSPASPRKGEEVRPAIRQQREQDPRVSRSSRRPHSYRDGALYGMGIDLRPRGGRSRA